jgi:hypothetical protein
MSLSINEFDLTELLKSQNAGEALQKWGGYLTGLYPSNKIRFQQDPFLSFDVGGGD